MTNLDAWGGKMEEAKIQGALGCFLTSQILPVSRNAISRILKLD